MVKKWVSKHDFIGGKPKNPLIDLELDDFIPIRDGNGNRVGDDIAITIGNNEDYFSNLLINPSNLLHISDGGIYYQDQPLVTEDRLRDIVREIMGEYLGGE
jgi:hypothetical protein